MPLVTTSGFEPAPAGFIYGLETLPLDEEGLVLDLPNDVEAAAIVPHFGRLSAIRIAFPTAADGRGFSLARRLRDLGYRGRLTAVGHVISDQFRYALNCGFDSVEISDDLAERQPEQHWRVTQHGPLGLGYRDRLAGRVAAQKRRPAQDAIDVPNGVFAVTVADVQHYTDRLFRFRVARPRSFRFRSGEFVMIGLPARQKPVFRAYSIAAPAWEEELEFYSIKVPGGPLTEHLQNIRPGDTIWIREKAVGTLINDALMPGKRLWLFSTGTGVAPFASLIRDPETYEKFDEIILTHTCRETADLAYGREIVANAKADPLVGEEATARLIHYATTTRENSSRKGRITDLITSGQVFRDLDVPPLSPETDRAMICGSIAMTKDIASLCRRAGLREGTRNAPGAFVVERAFVG